MARQLKSNDKSNKKDKPKAKPKKKAAKKKKQDGFSTPIRFNKSKRVKF